MWEPVSSLHPGRFCPHLELMQQPTQAQAQSLFLAPQTNIAEATPQAEQSSVLQESSQAGTITVTATLPKDVQGADPTVAATNSPSADALRPPSGTSLRDRGNLCLRTPTWLQANTANRSAGKSGAELGPAAAPDTFTDADAPAVNAAPPPLADAEAPTAAAAGDGNGGAAADASPAGTGEAGEAAAAAGGADAGAGSEAEAAAGAQGSDAEPAPAADSGPPPSPMLIKFGDETPAAVLGPGGRDRTSHSQKVRVTWLHSANDPAFMQ